MLLQNNSGKVIKMKKLVNGSPRFYFSRMIILTDIGFLLLQLKAILALSQQIIFWKFTYLIYAVNILNYKKVYAYVL